MLTRRNLFKSAATISLSALAPWLDRPALSAVEEAKQGCEPVGDDSRSQFKNPLLELEYLENLKDDLDCAEVVARVGSALKNLRRIEAEPVRGTSHCPFCIEAGFRVGAEFFACRWCEAEGSAIEFYARAEGLPHVEAASRIDALIKEGELRGRVRENEHVCRILEES